MFVNIFFNLNFMCVGGGGARGRGKGRGGEGGECGNLKVVLLDSRPSDLSLSLSQSHLYTCVVS